MSLLSLTKQLRSYKIPPGEGGSILAFWGKLYLAFWGKLYLAFTMLHLPLLF